MKTVYSGHRRGPTRTLLGKTVAPAPSWQSQGADVIRGLSPEPGLFGGRFRFGVALLGCEHHSGVFTKTKREQTAGREPGFAPRHNSVLFFEEQL